MNCRAAAYWNKNIDPTRTTLGGSGDLWFPRGSVWTLCV